ncbi:MAG: DUF2203 domain-containing protein [Phycisphaerae bacterium]
MDMSKTRPQRRSSRTADRKLFTLEHANSALPLVRRVVSDVVEQYRVVVGLQQRLEELPAKGGGDARREIEEAAGEAVEKLRGLAGELDEIGVELKDWQSGLIDFPAMHEGRAVYLCWRLGEEQVSFWHELDAGFRGRQPIDGTFSP